MRHYKFWAMLSPINGVVTGNPLFIYGVRRVRWWQDENSPVQYTRRLLIWTVSAGVVLGFSLMALAALTVFMPNFGYERARRLIADMNDFVTIAFVGTTLVALLIDFEVLGVVLYGLYANRTKEFGDLLHLTPLTGYDLVASQYAIARLKVWRVTVALAGIRLATLILYLLIGGFWHPLLLREGMRQGFYLSSDPFEALLQMAYILTLFGVAILEPFWRYRMVTALAVTVATRFKHLWGAVAGGAVIVLLIVTAPQIIFVPPVFEWVTFSLSGIAALVGLIGSTWFIFGWYASVERVALFRAQQVIFREGRD